MWNSLGWKDHLVRGTTEVTESFKPAAVRSKPTGNLNVNQKKKKLGRVVRVEWLLKSVCFFFYFTWLLSYVFEGHAQSVLLKVYTLHFHSIHTHANAGDKEILEFAAFQSGIDELRPAKFVSSKDVWLLADLKERKL